MTPHAQNNIMKTWLKSIGSAQKPITEAPFHGEYSAEHIGFRKAGKPSIRTGDHLFLYAPGGSSRIFALAEVTGDPESDPNYNSNEKGSCRWRLCVRYLINLPVASGIQVGDVISQRDLTKSLRQKSHVRQPPKESQSAGKKLQERARQ